MRGPIRAAVTAGWAVTNPSELDERRPGLVGEGSGLLHGVPARPVGRLGEVEALRQERGAVRRHLPVSAYRAGEPPGRHWTPHHHSEPELLCHRQDVTLHTSLTQRGDVWHRGIAYEVGRPARDRTTS